MAIYIYDSQANLRVFRDLQLIEICIYMVFAPYAVPQVFAIQYGMCLGPTADPGHPRIRLAPNR